jgi:hypothetical protein
MHRICPFRGEYLEAETRRRTKERDPACCTYGIVQVRTGPRRYTHYIMYIYVYNINDDDDEG